MPFNVFLLFSNILPCICNMSRLFCPSAFDTNRTSVETAWRVPCRNRAQAALGLAGGGRPLDRRRAGVGERAVKRVGVARQPDGEAGGNRRRLDFGSSGEHLGISLCIDFA